MLCPHCHKQTVFDVKPEGYATERWQGNRKEQPYVQCVLCTATFPKYAIDELDKGKTQ